jgi:hypothetical protein
MKKIIVIALCLLTGTLVYSQKKLTRSGEIKFEATTSFEEIAGKNSTVSCILDETNGNFVVLVLVKGFKFKSPLMEEHFNENYLESSKFPKSTFKGKILDFDASKLSATKSAFDLEGDLMIHGVTKKIKTKIYLVVNAGKMNAITTFSVKPPDYGIEIPNLVKDKIAENVKLQINFTLE